MSVMKRFVDFLFLVLLLGVLSACGGGGGSAGTPSGSASPTNFRVNAPATAALTVGQKVSYSISGGLSPYQITNTAPNVVYATVVAGNLEVTPLLAGNALLTVSPAGGGASQTLSVTVSTSLISLQVQAPDAVTLRLGSSASYPVLGGVAPYRVVSSEPAVLTASMVGSSLQVNAVGTGTAVISIYDASNGDPIKRTFTVVATGPFFTSAPSNLSLGSGTTRSFTVSGGIAPYFANSSNTSVVDVSLSGGNLTFVTGSTSGTADVVLKDSGGSIITVSVTGGTSAALYSSAPESLTMQGGSSRTFAIGGGRPPYAAISGNTNVVTATVSGTNVTLVAQNRGATTVRLTDALGASISVTVTVEQGTVATVGSIELTSSLISVRSAGEEAVITALVKSAANTGIPNADITFSSDSGILLAPSAQTDASGIATVRLAPGSNRANRKILITARVGAASQSIGVAVVGTTVTVSGPSALQVGFTATPYNVRALDSAGNPVSGVSLTGTSILGNGLSPGSVTTDLNGNGTLNYTPTGAGTDTLTVSGAGATSTPLSISISAVAFDYVASTPASNSTFGVNLAQSDRPTFKVRLLLNNAPVSGRTVVFSSTRGTLSSGTVLTDAAGEASVALDSSSAGPALVTAQVLRQAGDPGVGTVLATSTRTIQFTGVLPTAVRVQINPGAIPPNIAGVTTNRTGVTATVMDASSNPVAGRQVSFVINADPSNGSLTAGIATTDSNGVARVEYIAGQQSSPNNGVQITATVLAINNDIGLISQSAALTVNGNSLFITIGFGNTMENLNPTTYRKPFSVYVTDSTGQAVPNQTVALSVVPTRYYKGVMQWSDTSEVWVVVRSVGVGCANEDANLDGILNPGEDYNGNGTLTPGNVVVASPGSLVTDSSGIANFYLIYGEQFAYWVDVNLVARATVSGTESRREQALNLPALADDVTNKTVTPAGVRSPFGVANDCADPN